MIDGPDQIRQEEIQRRQRSRSIVMALVLGALVILFFGISWAKLNG